MIRAMNVTRAAGAPAGQITLTEDKRHRRRLRLVSDNGIEFLLDLPEARLLRTGDKLVLEDDRLIEVIAASEPLFEVRARDPRHLVKIAWQIGNRHLAAEILDGHILIRRDHVIRDMLQGLGATVIEVEAPFDPEGGAYGGHHEGHHHEGHPQINGGHSHEHHSG